MKRYLVYILTVLLVLSRPLCTLAQTAAETTYVAVDKEKGYDKKKRLFANYAINQLKGGALLVMLHTRDRAIQLYKEHDAKEVADQILTDQTLENRRTVAAFRKNFTFCPVYFFYDTHMDDIKKGTLAGVFLNDSLQPYANITMTSKFFMVADFGSLDEESFEFVQEGGHPSSSQSASGERSLVVRDNYFVQMRSPFPYSTAARIPKNADKQVIKLNAKLIRFYEKRKDANAPYPFPDIKK